jgi:hypothetical protein
LREGLLREWKEGTVKGVVVYVSWKRNGVCEATDFCLVSIFACIPIG